MRYGEAQHDVVTAVSYGDDVETGTDAINEVQTLGDVESGDAKKDDDPYIVDTPFFHLDLHSAVRAAESGPSKTRL